MRRENIYNCFEKIYKCAQSFIDFWHNVHVSKLQVWDFSDKNFFEFSVISKSGENSFILLHEVCISLISFFMSAFGIGSRENSKIWNSMTNFLEKINTIACEYFCSLFHLFYILFIQVVNLYYLLVPIFVEFWNIPLIILCTWIVLLNIPISVQYKKDTERLEIHWIYSYSVEEALTICWSFLNWISLLLNNGVCL